MRVGVQLSCLSKMRCDLGREMKNNSRETEEEEDRWKTQGEKKITERQETLSHSQVFLFQTEQN